MSIAEQIAAWPKMPKPARFDCDNGNAESCQGCYTMERDDDYGDYMRFEDYAALAARLATALEVLRAHVAACRVRDKDDGGRCLVCADARAILAACEVRK